MNVCKKNPMCVWKAVCSKCLSVDKQRSRLWAGAPAPVGTAELTLDQRPSGHKNGSIIFCLQFISFLFPPIFCFV